MSIERKRLILIAICIAFWANMACGQEEAGPTPGVDMAPPDLGMSSDAAPDDFGRPDMAPSDMLSDAADGGDAGVQKECGQGADQVSELSEEERDGCTVLLTNALFPLYQEEELPAYMAGIERISGAFSVSRAPNLLGLDALKRLESVGSLKLSELDNLGSIEALAALRRVEGEMTLSALPIQGLEGLEALEEVSGTLFITGVPDADSLAPLANLKSVGADLVITETSISQSQIDAFLERVEVGGKVFYEESN